MTYRLWGDLETYSETPISHGTYRYAANAEIMRPSRYACAVLQRTPASCASL